MFRAYAILWNGNEVVVSDMTAKSNHREGETINVLVMHIASGKDNREHIMFTLAPEVATPVVKPQTRVVQNPAQHAGYFECRDNELFCIEKDALEVQAAGAASGQTIGNVNYIVESSFLAMGMMRLQPRPNVRGEVQADLAQPESKFRKVLNKLSPKKDMIVLMVRDGSVGVCDKVRQIPESAGFSVG